MFPITKGTNQLFSIVLSSQKEERREEREERREKRREEKRREGRRETREERREKREETREKREKRFFFNSNDFGNNHITIFNQCIFLLVFCSSFSYWFIASIFSCITFTSVERRE